MQRKALVDSLQEIAKEHASVTEDIKKLLSKGSKFRSVSDDILQFVCGHRAESIEMKRNAFKNEALSIAVPQIHPSTTHLFEVKALSNLLKDNSFPVKVFQGKPSKEPIEFS